MRPETTRLARRVGTSNKPNGFCFSWGRDGAQSNHGSRCHTVNLSYSGSGIMSRLVQSQCLDINSCLRDFGLVYWKNAACGPIRRVDTQADSVDLRTKWLRNNNQLARGASNTSCHCRNTCVASLLQYIIWLPPRRSCRCIQVLIPLPCKNLWYPPKNRAIRGIWLGSTAKCAVKLTNYAVPHRTAAQFLCVSLHRLTSTSTFALRTVNPAIQTSVNTVVSRPQRMPRRHRRYQVPAISAPQLCPSSFWQAWLSSSSVICRTIS